MGFADIENRPNECAYSKVFFERWYRLQFTTLIVAGDVTPEGVMALVERYWGRLTVMLCSSALVVVVGVVVLAASVEQAAIRAARVAQNKAIAAGDLDRVASFWTEDVTVRRALGQPLSGREAARKALEPAPAPTSHLIYQRITRDVEVSANWPLAFETGTWEGHQGTVAGPVVIGGRFSAQWVKRGGRWLIRSEVFVALTCSGAGCQATAEP